MQPDGRHGIENGTIIYVYLKIQDWNFETECFDAIDDSIWVILNCVILLDIVVMAVVIVIHYPFWFLCMDWPELCIFLSLNWSTCPELEILVVALGPKHKVINTEHEITGKTDIQHLTWGRTNIEADHNSAAALLTM